MIEIDESVILHEAIATNTYVIAGGPCSGKTTLLTLLEERGCDVVYEPAEELLRASVKEGKSVQEVRQDGKGWQRKLVEADIVLFNSLSRDKLTFVDTSFVETWVYSRRVGLEFGPRLLSHLRSFRFAGVFFLEPLSRYESTKIRMEDRPTSRTLSEAVLSAYREFGHTPVILPGTDSCDRLELILRTVGRDSL